MDSNKGTTTIGLVCREGIVAAAERRATIGTKIAHKVAKKIFKIDDHMLTTTGDLVADAQISARHVSGVAE